MCGILGRIQTKQSERSQFIKRLDSLSHRGPDSSGIFEDLGGKLLLGHRRLSIIDLTDSNNQPFQTKRVTLCFNGEIYNFIELRAELESAGLVFETAGDSEVIAKGYELEGISFFEKCKGMYAIAIWDKEKGVLILLRDYFGIKPLYILENQCGIEFASEFKALDSRKIMDEGSFFDLLTFGYYHEETTFFKDIKPLPTGELWVLSLRDGKLQKQIVKHKEHLNRQPQFGITNRQLRSVIEESVQYHLIADVPIAYTLSGGLDSSIVTAIASKIHSNNFAITNSFNGKDDWEVKYSEKLAAHLQIDHEVNCSELKITVELLSSLLFFLEDPIPNIAVFHSYALAMRLKSLSYKIALIGEGADELFGGYPWYRFALQENLCNDPAKLFSQLEARRSMFAGLAPFLTETGKLGLKKRREFQIQNFIDCYRNADGSPLEKFMHFDRMFQMKTSQLQRVDRIFMSQSIEARVPFLYDDVLIASKKLLSKEKIIEKSFWSILHPRLEKISLAKSMKNHLPSYILKREKFGQRGTTDLQKQLKNDIDNVFENLLTTPRLRPAREIISNYIKLDVMKNRTVGVKLKLALSMILIALNGDKLNFPTKEAP